MHAFPWCWLIAVVLNQCSSSVWRRKTERPRRNGQIDVRPERQKDRERKRNEQRQGKTWRKNRGRKEERQGENEQASGEGRKRSLLSSGCWVNLFELWPLKWIPWMGVNRQQALQGGLASHQLVNVREEDGNNTMDLTRSEAVETWQHKKIWQRKR